MLYFQFVDLDDYDGTYDLVDLDEDDLIWNEICYLYNQCHSDMPDYF